MKNKSLIVLALSVAFFGVGCATKTVKVLDATWVSMKHPMPPNAKDNLTKVGPISEEYCLSSWTGTYGLIDEVVKQVESKHQIDYVKYPAFTQTEGTHCVQMSGEAYRVTR